MFESGRLLTMKHPVLSGSMRASEAALHLQSHSVAVPTHGPNLPLTKQPRCCNRSPHCRHSLQVQHLGID